METVVLTGRLEPTESDFVELPFNVPPGVTSLSVRYGVSPEGVCDIGLLDPRGFRGWSGSARDSLTLAADAATPGYRPGPLEPGPWWVLLGPYRVPAGGMEYRVTVTFGYEPAGPAYVPEYPADAVHGVRGWYRGDCHLHTVHSDGARTPAELAGDARRAGLDFLVSTEHNTSSAHGVWGRYATDGLLVVPGEEVTTRNGHWLAAGVAPGTWIDWRYRARDGVFPQFARQAREAGGLVVAAHPYCPYPGCAWKFGYADVDAVEVWNGPWGADDQSAVDTWDGLLATGRPLPAVGGSDAHARTDRVGHPQTVVRAEGLSRDAVLTALRLGRSYLAESAGVRVLFSVSGALVGEHLTRPAEEPLDVVLQVSGVPGGTASLITDQSVAYECSLDGAVLWKTSTARASYVRAEVRHPDGRMAALTNPVRLSPA